MTLFEALVMIATARGMPVLLALTALGGALDVLGL